MEETREAAAFSEGALSFDVGGNSREKGRGAFVALRLLRAEGFSADQSGSSCFYHGKFGELKESVFFSCPCNKLQHFPKAMGCSIPNGFHSARCWCLQFGLELKLLEMKLLCFLSSLGYEHFVSPNKGKFTCSYRKMRCGGFFLVVSFFSPIVQVMLYST